MMEAISCASSRSWAVLAILYFLRGKAFCQCCVHREKACAKNRDKQKSEGKCIEVRGVKLDGVRKEIEQRFHAFSSVSRQVRALDEVLERPLQWSLEKKAHEWLHTQARTFDHLAALAFCNSFSTSLAVVRSPCPWLILR